VQSLAVVEHFAVLDHFIPRFLPRGIVPQCGTLPLDPPTEPLGHGVVYAFALAAPPTADAMFRQQVVIGMTRLVTPPIRMLDQPGRGTPAPQRHAQRGRHQGGIQPALPRPAHHRARMQVPQGCIT
jgi:hypothetical protein